MSNYIDLSLFTREDLIFGVPIGKDESGEMKIEKFNIPGSISTGFVLKMSKYKQDMENINSDEVAIVKMKEIVRDILNLDKTKDVDVEYIERYLDNVKLLGLIFEKTMEHIQDVAEDENLNSPQFTSNKKKGSK